MIGISIKKLKLCDSAFYMLLINVKTFFKIYLNKVARLHENVLEIIAITLLSAQGKLYFKVNPNALVKF